MDEHALNDLIDKYAIEAETIYNNRTAGDFTWIGLLAKFAQEAGLVNNG